MSATDVDRTFKDRNAPNLVGQSGTLPTTDCVGMREVQNECDLLSILAKFFKKPIVAVILIIMNSIFFEFVAYCINKKSGIRLLFKYLGGFPSSDKDHKRHLEQNWLVVNSIATLTLITGIIPLFAAILNQYVRFNPCVFGCIIVISVVAFVSSVLALEFLLVLIVIEDHNEYRRGLAWRAAVAHSVSIEGVVIIFLMVIYSIKPLWWGYLIGVAVYWTWGFYLATINAETYKPK